MIEVLKYRYNRGRRSNINFYRDSIGNEVDLIYNIGAHFLPMEIKSSETIISDFFKGLKAIEKVVPNLPHGKCVIYAGERAEHRQDIQISNVANISKILDKF